MSIMNEIVWRIKDLIDGAKEKLAPSVDEAAEGEMAEPDATGNPITDLYNKALIHPATTIGLLAAVIGVGATIAFVVAEQRAQKGIIREMEREGARLRKRARVWTQKKALPRVKDYHRKYNRRAKRWLKRHDF